MGVGSKSILLRLGGSEDGETELAYFEWHNPDKTIALQMAVRDDLLAPSSEHCLTSRRSSPQPPMSKPDDDGGFPPKNKFVPPFPPQTRHIKFVWERVLFSVGSPNRLRLHANQAPVDPAVQHLAVRGVTTLVDIMLRECAGGRVMLLACFGGRVRSVRPRAQGDDLSLPLSINLRGMMLSSRRDPEGRSDPHSWWLSDGGGTRLTHLTSCVADPMESIEDHAPYSAPKVRHLPP
jgi:hypothetical protein